MATKTKTEDKQLATTELAAETIAKLILGGDISGLTEPERVDYYKTMAIRVGLDPVTKPFDVITLPASWKSPERTILYCTRSGAAQLNKLHNVSRKITARRELDDLYLVDATASTPDGRSEDATGAVTIYEEGGEWKTARSGKRYWEGNGQWTKLRGEDLANAIMKCETKAKRRAVLDLIGLGIICEEEAMDLKKQRERELESQHEETAIQDHEANRLAVAGLNPEEAQPWDGNGEHTEKPVEGREVVPSTTHTAPPTKTPTAAPQKRGGANGKHFTDMEAEELPESEKWRAYRISQINVKKFFGERLDKFDLESLRTLHKSWVLKHAEMIAKNPAKKAEADMIVIAANYRDAQDKKEYKSDKELEKEFFSAKKGDKK